MKQGVLSSMLLSHEKKSGKESALAREASAALLIQPQAAFPAQRREGVSEAASGLALAHMPRPSAPSNLVDLSNIDDTDTTSHSLSILDSVGSSSVVSSLTHGSASTVSGSAASVRTVSLGASTPARKLVFSDVDYGCPIMTEYVDEIYQHYLSEEVCSPFPRCVPSVLLWLSKCASAGCSGPVQRIHALTGPDKREDASHLSRLASRGRKQVSTAT
jgi:hypothetical protein